MKFAEVGTKFFLAAIAGYLFLGGRMAWSKMLPAKNLYLPSNLFIGNWKLEIGNSATKGAAYGAKG